MPIPSTTLARWCVIISAITSITMLRANAYSVTGSTSYNYGSYVSEYVTLDNGGSWTWDSAYSACPSYGAGWQMAGIYSDGGNSAVNSIVNAISYIGGLSPLGEDYNTATYIWYAGRYKGELISQGYGPSTCDFYCNYYPGEPNGATCSGNAYREHALEMYASGLWNDIHETGCPGDTYSAVVCERSACTVAADCYAAGTSSVSGSYSPDCTCNCKSGYRGGKCQVLDTTVSADGTD